MQFFNPFGSYFIITRNWPSFGRRHRQRQFVTVVGEYINLWQKQQAAVDLGNWDSCRHSGTHAHTAGRQWDTQLRLLLLLLGQRHPQQFAMIFGAQRLVLRNFYVFIIIQMESTLPQRHATCHTHTRAHTYTQSLDTNESELFNARAKAFLSCDAMRS